MYMTASLLGPFSLTKRAPKEILFARISFSFQKAPDDTGISSAAALDQQALAPLDTRHPFEKGGRKLYFFATFLSTAAKREVFSLLTFFFYQKESKETRFPKFCGA